MLLTLGDMDFLSKMTEKNNEGLLVSKPDISEEEKQRLLDIDNMNFMTYGEHLIKMGR